VSGWRGEGGHERLEEYDVLQALLHAPALMLRIRTLCLEQNGGELLACLHHLISPHPSPSVSLS